MSKKILTGTLAALALAATLAGSVGQAQAKPKFGPALGIGIATGLIVGAAVANSYAEPVYVDGPSYRCRYIDRFNAYGEYVRTVKVCDVPY